ncbi:MAG: ABC transporter permease [Cytophagaceae bacterium]
MNVPLFIARRYFLSKKKTNFINVISVMSMVGVAFVTMALVVALSVFNGLENLIRTLYNSFDPELKVTATMGKAFTVDEAFLNKVKQVEGVDIITEVIEDNALLKYREDQMVVKVKGVSDNFTQQNRMDSMITEGEFTLHKDSMDYAIIGRGVQYKLSIPVDKGIFPLQVWYPKTKNSLSLDPGKLFNRENIMAGAVFAIEKQYDDNYIFVPLEFTQRLLNYSNKRTSLEIKSKEGYKMSRLQENLKNALGPGFKVQNSDEQHASLLRAVKIEKLFMHITISVILAIASLNIFFSLSMLALEKKKDVAILFSMGASQNFIKKIFLGEGMIIAFTGAISGLVIGLLICIAQQQFKIVPMGMETSIVDAYPVKMELGDFISTGVTIFLITMLISYRPAVKASRINIKESL